MKPNSKPSGRGDSLARFVYPLIVAIVLSPLPHFFFEHLELQGEIVNSDITGKVL